MRATCIVNDDDDYDDDDDTVVIVMIMMIIINGDNTCILLTRSLQQMNLMRRVQMKRWKNLQQRKRLENIK